MSIRRFWSLFLLLLLLLTASCKKVKVDENIGRINVENIIEKDGQLFLYRQNSVVILRHGSSKVEFGGIQIILPDEVLRDNDGIWHLPLRSVNYLSNIFKPWKLKVETVIIDLGHGGSDPGAISVNQKIKEKDINLDLALKLGAALRSHGFNVLFTREDDRTVPLSKRGQMYEADLFISIHHNASKNINASGAETYCLLSDDIQDNSRISPAFQIACEMQKFQSQASGNYGRGVKFAQFRVLKDAKSPAILFETGFITHPDEEKRCVSAEYRQIMAEALAQGIARAVSL